jgi:hypothetical protein
MIQKVSDITENKVRHKERPLKEEKEKFKKLKMLLKIKGTIFGNGQIKTLSEGTRWYYKEMSSK